ncbi:MAG: hypothetical protein OEW68_09490 [Gammaproteobacteria bacterium]|nr:hypothetical protein [Gammaproteobacteria bacterium]MDH4315061.1 hypothetical protein [Gammaproteobacteria bacterium]MDH5214032.1 hypothetical protein [Gammaproteobacteria bacterium]
MIVHNVYALAGALIALQSNVPVEGISNPGELTNENVSVVYNLEYTAIDDTTSAGLPQDTGYYRVADNAVVSTLDGLNLERRLALVDLGEALVQPLVPSKMAKNGKNGAGSIFSNKK